MGLGVFFGFVMGLLMLLFDILTDSQHHVLMITLGLMLLEGVIGFFIASGGRNRFDDVMSFIVAFFLVP